MPANDGGNEALVPEGNGDVSFIISLKIFHENKKKIEKSLNEINFNENHCLFYEYNMIN